MSTLTLALNGRQGRCRVRGPIHASRRTGLGRTRRCASPQVRRHATRGRVGGSRFLSVDPIFGGSANAYDYAMQDPVNQFDLDGRMVGAQTDEGRVGADSSCYTDACNATRAKKAWLAKWGRRLSKMSNLPGKLWFCGICQGIAAVLGVIAAVFLAKSQQGKLALGQVVGMAVSAAVSKVSGASKVLKEIMSHKRLLQRVLGKAAVSNLAYVLGYGASVPLCGRTPWCG